MSAPRRDTPSELRSAPDLSIRAYSYCFYSCREVTCRRASRGPPFKTRGLQAQHDDLVLLLCVLSYNIRSYERRVRGTRRQLAVVTLRRGEASAFPHCGGTRTRTHRSLLVLVCVPTSAAVVHTRLCSGRVLPD